MSASATPRLLNALRCELVLQRNGAPGAMALQLQNTGSEAITLLRRNTPLEPMRANFLRVSRNKHRLQYVGPVVKRAAPTLEEYVVIAPGSSMLHEFDASQGYDFSKPGRYQVSWNGELLDAALGSAAPNPLDPNAARILCAPITFER